MPHTRRQDQAVEAFSAPKSLLTKARDEALRRGFTKSGFFRYFMAIKVGYSEEESKAIAKHRAIQLTREALEARNYSAHRGQAVLNEKSEQKINSALLAGVKAVKEHLKTHPTAKPKRAKSRQRGGTPP